ncbi:MAG: LysR family transcriptional regulator [Bdellovibrionota bacterium]
METINHNLDVLAAFHQVALNKNFSQAAETLGTSKAMVSKQVKQLESYLSAQLFQRTTRRVTLTEEGLALFSYSQKIFDLSSEASKKIKDISQGMSGVIRFSAPVSLGDVFFPAVLSELKLVLPQVSFEMDLSNDNRDIVKDRIDFAIRASENHSPDLIARHLGRIKDVICVSPSYLKKEKINLKDFHHPRDLQNYNCILSSLNSAWNTWTLTKSTGDICIDVRGSYSTNQYPMILSLCRKGCGIAKLPRYLVSEDLNSGKLVQLFEDHQISTHPLYLVYSRDDYATKKKKLVRDAILSWFKQNKDFFV